MIKFMRLFQTALIFFLFAGISFFALTGKAETTSPTEFDSLLEDSQNSEKMLREQIQQQVGINKLSKKSAPDFKRVAIESLGTPSSEGVPVNSKKIRSPKISKNFSTGDEIAAQRRLQREFKDAREP